MKKQVTRVIIKSSHSFNRPSTSKSNYTRNKASGIRVTVIKTGDRAKHAVVTVTSLDQLMSEATSKLKCTSAVRKVYFRDGTEIESLLQIPRNGEVFVSCFGERPGGSQGQKPGKLSKAQNAVSTRLADSKVQKVKVCANGSGKCVSILVKRIDDNEHFLSVLGQLLQ